ncbi:dTDP-glucose 4,6-dehydratase [Trypanosoma cruzi]|nr:dTDP-glucose 4,6-dehydratase [Trypanosoma cruzi]
MKKRPATARHSTGIKADIAKASQSELREGTILKLLRCPAPQAPKPKLGSHTGEVRGPCFTKTLARFRLGVGGLCFNNTFAQRGARRPSRPRREGGAIGGEPLSPPKRHKAN